MKMEIEMNLNKKFYYKYIHLLYGHDTKFSKLLIRIITNPQNGFIVDEHLFITMYQNVYNELKSFGNVGIIQENYMPENLWRARMTSYKKGNSIL